MKVPILFFAFMALHCTIFSQTTSKKKAFSEHRMNVRKAANYYLRKKIDPTPEFSVQYTSLFSGLQGYTRRDTLLANKLINRLYKVNDNLFYRLMRIRLEWEFKQRFARSPLDSVRPFLKNNIDSAKFYYMRGLWFQDTLTEYLGRSLGYVKATPDGKEVVDRRKMESLKWRDPKTIETSHDLIEDNHSHIEKNFNIDLIRNSSIFFYKMAIDNDPTEFHYLKELVLFMSNLAESKDEEIKEVITSKLENYTGKEKKWLKNYLE